MPPELIFWSEEGNGFCGPLVLIDVMHDDVTRLKGSMVVVVTLKSKMAASSASSSGNSKSTGSMIYLKAQTNRTSRLIDGPATSEHMSALLSFKFPSSGKYSAILNSCVTATTTMHTQAAKALIFIIVH